MTYSRKRPKNPMVQLADLGSARAAMETAAAYIRSDYAVVVVKRDARFLVMGTDEPVAMTGGPIRMAAIGEDT
jgi:hypothetical protein